VASPIRIDVYVRTLGGEMRHAGEVAFLQSKAGPQFGFKYVEGWLNDRNSFDLDPRGAPRSIGLAEISGRVLRPELGFLDDALPDAWGRSLLNLSGHDQEAQLMRKIGGGALGALAFADKAAAPEIPPVLAVQDLGELLEAAEAFERHETLDAPHLQRLLAAGSSPGGARPKALVADAEGLWLAKFPSRRDDNRDIVGLEATCLELARRAGMRVPESRLLKIGRRRVLLVRRFDVPEDRQREVEGSKCRRHGISMSTLMRELPTGSNHSYTTLSEQLRRVSANPAEDVTAFFRQMIFNAAIGNTDDHLRNFRLLHGEDGWRLAPAFDLLPDVGRLREHSMDFLYGRECPNRELVLQMARNWGVRSAEEILYKVCSAVDQYAAVCEEMGVPGDDAALYRGNIDRRLRELRTPPGPRPGVKRVTKSPRAKGAGPTR
jgi:serine/threonine-protein kinase HipA